MNLMPVQAALRGEIWFVKLPSDPKDKGPRPVVIASTNARNAHPRADTVLVIPFSTSTVKDVPDSRLFVSRRNRLRGVGSEGGGHNSGSENQPVKTAHCTPQSE